jgi:hypothetical protein
VRTALDKLKSTCEITVKSTSTYTLITLTNYNVYQDKVNLSNTVNNTQDNNQVTNEQQTDNKRATTTKEIKEDKKIIIPNFIDQVSFDQFLKQRKEDKNPLEGFALKITIEDLEKWEKKKAGNANLAIRNAIKGGWKSLIEPSEGKVFGNQEQKSDYQKYKEARGK